MDATLDKTATETIDLLEARLQRIEYAVTGGQLKNSTASSTTIEAPAAKRLADLEHKLHQLASKSRVIQDLLRLHATHPDLFQSVGPQDLPTSLNPSDILSIVLASASSYLSIASRLASISDVSIPAAEMSAHLIDLQPRIAKFETFQTAQNSEIAELRQRSAVVLQRWYSVDILSTGDSWAELEGRVETAEQRIRRVALAKRKDNDLI